MRASACASPGKAEGGTGRPPPPKQKQGGGAREQPTATKPPANTTRGGQTPHPEGTEDRFPKRAQGDHRAQTGNTKPGTAVNRKKGHPKRADTRHAEKYKKASNPARKRGDGGDRDHKARDRDSQRPTPQSQSKIRPKKNAPRQPNQEGRGKAETRAQHARPHSTPKRGKAGNKRGARTNTHPRTAPPTRRSRRPRGTGGSGGAQP